MVKVVLEVLLALDLLLDVPFRGIDWSLAQISWSRLGNPPARTGDYGPGGVLDPRLYVDPGGNSIGMQFIQCFTEPSAFKCFIAANLGTLEG